jgi:hypothetical protein
MHHHISHVTMILILATVTLRVEPVEFVVTALPKIDSTGYKNCTKNHR